MRPLIFLIVGFAMISCQPAEQEVAEEPAEVSGKTEEVAVVLPLDNIEWAEIVPGLSFGTVYGVWAEEAHGKLAKFDPGFMSPWHTHTGAYHGVVITGTLTNPFEGEENPPEMGPGDYWFVPGGANHTTNCLSEEPCLIYTHAAGLWDITVTEVEGG